MTLSRLALAAAILTAGLSFGHAAKAEGSCGDLSIDVDGDYNDVRVNCTPVDAEELAREILRQSQRSQPSMVLVCTNGYFTRQILNPVFEVNQWNQCYMNSYVSGWAEWRRMN